MTGIQERSGKAVLSNRRSLIGDDFLCSDACNSGQQRLVDCVASIGSRNNPTRTAIKFRSGTAPDRCRLCRTIALSVASATKSP